MLVRVAICDDVSLQREQIKNYVKYYCLEKGLEVSIDEYDSGELLLESNSEYDILFLDIEMGNKNGIEVTKEINKKSKNTNVIIVTDYRQYLDDAMDLDVLRYVDKPVSQDRIYKCLNKALDVMQTAVVAITTKDNGKVLIIKKDIVYLEIVKRNILVKTVDNTFYSKEKMDYFRDSLNTPNFISPHNSYIVNLKYMTAFEREENQIVLLKKIKVPIAQRKRTEVRRNIIDYLREERNGI